MGLYDYGTSAVLSALVIMFIGLLVKQTLDEAMHRRDQIEADH